MSLVALVAAIVADSIIAAIAVLLFKVPPEFGPLQPGAYIFFSVIGAVAAGIAFALVARFAPNPLRTYYVIATIALVLSFIPDIQLLGNPSQFPGTTVPAVVTLMIMHIVDAAIIVGLLTRLTRR